VRSWASLCLSLVLMLCNLRQDTFIDYPISECGLGQITVSLMTIFLFQCCAALGRTLLLIILLPLLDCGRANHFTFSCCKTLLIYFTMGLMQIRYMCSGLC
jgi:hypothetical protein